MSRSCKFVSSATCPTSFFPCLVLSGILSDFKVHKPPTVAARHMLKYMVLPKSLKCRASNVLQLLTGSLSALQLRKHLQMRRWHV